MSKKLLLFFILLIIFIATFSYFSIFQNNHSVFEKNKLNIADVRGMDFYYQGSPYSLTLDDQKKVVDIINRSIKFDAKVDVDTNEELENFEKLVILRFHNLVPTIVFPLGYKDGCMIFTIPNWSYQQLYKEETCGEFERVLLDIL